MIIIIISIIIYYYYYHDLLLLVIFDLLYIYMHKNMSLLICIVVSSI